MNTAMIPVPMVLSYSNTLEVKESMGPVCSYRSLIEIGKDVGRDRATYFDGTKI